MFVDALCDGGFADVATDPADPAFVLGRGPELRQTKFAGVPGPGIHGEELPVAVSVARGMAVALAPVRSGYARLVARLSGSRGRKCILTPAVDRRVAAAARRTARRGRDGCCSTAGPRNVGGYTGYRSFHLVTATTSPRAPPLAAPDRAVPAAVVPGRSRGAFGTAGRGGLPRPSPER